MPVDIVLSNAKIFTKGQLVEAELAIDQGKIVKIAKPTNMPSASKKIDLNGNVVLPGLIDCHVHLRDQQLAYKETFSTGTAAAAAGGVTSVIDMPNNQPATMDSETLKERINVAQKKVIVNVGFNSAFPTELEEISEIVKVGAVGFKVYLANQIGGLNIDDDELLFSAFEQASKMRVPVAVHAEERKILDEQRKAISVTKQADVQAYLKAHPAEAETKSIERVLRLVKNSGVHIHFCHLSSEQGLNTVELAKKEAGLRVTCEVTPHNLLLDSKQYNHSGFFALTDPPLRTKKDQTALWMGIKKGAIDVIATDHAPHSREEKNVKSVWGAKPGVPGLETTLPLLLDQVNKKRLELTDLVRITAEKPATIYHLSKRGFLDAGNWADIVVVDMKQEHTIDSSLFFSKAKYSPFDGISVKGKPVKTFVNGQLVVDEGELVAEFATGTILGNDFCKN